jgi:hypothetical protein
MSFESFCERVITVFGVSGEPCDVSFRREDGKHIARFSNGVKIVGNALSRSVMVFWGSGHAARATL